MRISPSPGFNTEASKQEAEVLTARCDSHNKQLRYLSEHQPGDLCNGVVVFSVKTRTKTFNTIASGKLQNAPTGFTTYADVYPSVPMYNSRTSKRFLLNLISQCFWNLWRGLYINTCTRYCAHVACNSLSNNRSEKYLWQTVLYRKNKHGLCSKIKSTAVQIKKYIDCIELHVSTYLRSFSGVGVLVMCGCFGNVWVFR